MVEEGYGGCRRTASLTLWFLWVEGDRGWAFRLPGVFTREGQKGQLSEDWAAVLAVHSFHTDFIAQNVQPQVGLSSKPKAGLGR